MDLIVTAADREQLDKQLAPLSEDIHLLGDALGHVIVEQHGLPSFQLEERVRRAAIARRAGDAGSQEVLDEAIQGASLSERQILIKAFSNYFQLVNIAEDQHRIRVLRERESSGTLRESIGAALQRLADAGLDAEEVRDLLEKMSVELVLTAHPTEAKRHEVLFKLRRIGTLVDRRDRIDLTPREQRRFRADLLQEIEALWQTDPTRAMAPSVMDEVDFGLYYLTSTIQEAASLIYQETREDLEAIYPDSDWHRLPAFLRYASWIGSDRDGHPEVTPAVTLVALRRMRRAAREDYLGELAVLRDHLTQAVNSLDDELRDRAQLPGAGAGGEYAGEPFRGWVERVRRQLGEGDLLRGEELSDELWSLADYLRAHRGAHAARGDVWRLAQRAQVFGLQLASLDLRQDVRRLVKAVGDFLGACGRLEDYQAAGEKERERALLELLPQAEAFQQWDGARTPVWEETADLMTLAAEILSQHGETAIGSLIGSMASAPSDLLAMLCLARTVGIDGALDIVPLFETVEDLKRSAETIGALLRIPEYRRHLKERDDCLQVMIGYSDSVKDGGYLASNWNLYLAQERLAEVCQQAGVRLEIFHGRGGSIGRGGGPSNRAILSLPPGAMAAGKIRMTEQGEVIAYRYGRRGIARRHLHQLLHATLLATASPVAEEPLIAWRRAMGDLAVWGQRAYRDLVYGTDGFFEYWQQATPYPELTELQIGSRPAKRREGGFEAVRAIPWVFSWMQCRVLLPSWFGIGTAFEKYAADGEGGLDRLIDMYGQWPFFRLLIDNVELDLAKVELGIAERYSSLVADREVAAAIFGRIRREYQRTRQSVLAITGRDRLLDGMPVIQRSIERRNPYVDPLNFIQVELLHELRATDESDPRYAQLRAATLSTVKGLAAAMKTTG